MAGPRPWDDGAVEDEIVALERVTAQHWRGTEEEWLGGWLLPAAAGVTGRADSAPPPAGALPPMIAIPRRLGADASAAGCQLDHQLSERAWLTRPGPAFVMVADLASVP